MTEAIRQKLKAEVQAVNWPDLKPHAARGALLLLDPGLDLLDVATAVATDDVKAIEKWLQSNQIQKATTDAEAEQTTRFQFVIVQPYVLAQALANAADAADEDSLPS